ncbi:MAG: LacI family DNA-binding transcriptional regulator [bacterium]
MKKKDRSPTIKDVAQRAGVSVATVSAVINKSRFVSDELVGKVLKAINKLNYYPNRIARGLKTRNSRTVAYIIPDINNPIFARVTRGVQDTMEEASYDVSLYNTDFSDKKLFRHLTTILESRVSGIILSAWHSPKVKEATSLIQNLNIPLVIVHSPRNIDNVDSILVDDKKGAHEATYNLIRLGHKRIVSLGVKDSTTSRLRGEGYKKALLENGLAQEKDLIVQTDSFSPDDAFLTMQELYESNLDFTAIFAYSDLLAVGAAEATLERGLRIPEDISIIAFDDTYSSLASPKLTTMHVPNHEMGIRAAQILLERLNSSSVTEPPIREEIIPTFIERKSTRDLLR